MTEYLDAPLEPFTLFPRLHSRFSAEFGAHDALVDVDAVKKLAEGVHVHCGVAEAQVLHDLKKHGERFRTQNTLLYVH